MFKAFIFPVYARMAGIRRRPRRRQVTDRGRLLQTGTIVCLALGIDTDLNLVYQLFALLVVLILGSRLFLYFTRPRVAVRRQLPQFATAGEPFTYHVEVINLGDRVEQDLRLVDQPATRVPSLAEYISHQEPGEETRNAYDRSIGFHRFMWLLRLKTGIRTEPCDLPDIGIHARVMAAVEATPLRRGIVTFRATQVLHPDPMGLTHGIVSFDNSEQLIALPRRYQLSARFRLPGSRHFQPGGVDSTWSIGESDEFVSLRDYREGDSLRKIHWASSAKRNKPVVKEYREEYLIRQALLLETETEQPPVLEAAISLAASLILNETQSDAMLDLIYFSESAEVLSSGHGAMSVNRQLEALACLEASANSIEALTAATLRHGSELSGCIILLTDMDASREAMIASIRNSGVALEVIVVTDRPDEISVPPAIHVLDARDMEREVAKL